MSEIVVEPFEEPQGEYEDGFYAAQNQDVKDQDETEQLVPLTEEQAALAATYYHLPFKAMHARAWHLRMPEFYDDDILSYLQLELCKLAVRYDPNVGANFMTFAYPRLCYAIVDALREVSSQEGRPRSALDKQKRARAEEDRLLAEGVTDLSLAAKTFLVWHVSLDQLVGPDRSNQPVSLSDLIPDQAPSPEHQVTEGDMEEQLKKCIASLPYAERFVIERALDGEMLADIGEELGVTESRVCQIYDKAAHKLALKMGIPRKQRISDKQLGNNILGSLLSTPDGSMSERERVGVITRLVTRTGASADQVSRVLANLVSSGLVEAEAQLTVHGNAKELGKISLTKQGWLLERPSDAIARAQYTAAPTNMEKADEALDELLGLFDQAS